MLRHDKINQELKSIDFLRKFVLCFLIIAAIHWGLFVLYPNGAQRSVFFGRGSDFMADFFNVLRYIAGRNPYLGEVGSPAEKAYLPFAYLLLFPFARLDDYSNMSLTMCWDSHIALISAIFFTLISCFFFYFSLKKLCEKWNVNDIILEFFLLFLVEKTLRKMERK